MRKPKPHGPYSAEELSNMDDAELGRLYREKNRPTKVFDFAELGDSFLFGVLIGLVPSAIAGVIFRSGLAFVSVFVFCTISAAIWYLVDVLIKKSKRHNSEEDAFDDLYPHEEDDFKKAFDYLRSAIDEKTENKDDSLNKWISILKKISSDDGSDYTDAELGQLLKIIIPILSYMKESGHNIQDTDFEALDKEFNLTKQLNDFMDTSYAEMHDRTKTKLKVEKDNKREKAKQLASKIKDKNKRYAEGLVELEKSADYRKMMDLKRTLDEKKKKLSDQVKTEEQKSE